MAGNSKRLFSLHSAHERIEAHNRAIRRPDSRLDSRRVAILVWPYLSTSQRNRRELPQLMHKLVPTIGRDHKLFVLPIDLVSIVAEDVG